MINGLIVGQGQVDGASDPKPPAIASTSQPAFQVVAQHLSLLTEGISSGQLWLWHVK
jgi:hypothetical protein